MGKKYLIIFIILSLLVNLVVFLFMYFNNILTDIQDHAQFIKVSIESKTILANFLYYLTVFIVSGFSLNIKKLFITSIIVLTIANVIKFILSYKLINNTIFKDFKFENKTKELLFFCCLISLFLLHPIITPLDFSNYYFYLGKLAINIWHNSTTIFVMPFVILLVFYSYSYLKNNSIKNLLFIFIFGLLLIFVKPSFIFTFFIVYPLFVLYYYRFSKSTLLVAINLFILALFLLLQYLIIYKFGNYDDLIYESQKSEIKIRPFLIFSKYSENIYVDFLSSILFPFLFYLSDLKNNKKLLLLNYMWALLIGSLVIGILFVETGPRLGHGNFLWQIPMSNYILFLVSTFLFLKKIFIYNINRYDIMLIIIWFLHLLSGVFYLKQLLLAHSYY